MWDSIANLQMWVKKLNYGIERRENLTLFSWKLAHGRMDVRN